MKMGHVNKGSYIGDGFDLTRIRKKVCKTLAKVLPGYKQRVWLLRKCNYQVGEDVFIGEDLIVIDDLRDDGTNLTIGDRVAISPRVTLVLHSTPNWSRIANYVNAKMGSIDIGSDAWIGTGAVILPDISIGEGAVIGSNAVVTKDVPPFAIVAGIPARQISEVIIPEAPGRSPAT